MIHASSISVKMEVTCWVFVAGAEPTLFGKPKFCCMRLHYRNGETVGYFHTLRAVTRNPEDDGKGLIVLCNKVLWMLSFFSLFRLTLSYVSDTLQCIAEMLRITKQAMGLDLLVVEKKLERCKFLRVKIITFFMHLIHIRTVDHGCPNPVLESHNPHGFSVLPGRHLSSWILFCQEEAFSSW